MAKGPWKKNKPKKLKGIDGKYGYLLDRKVVRDSRGMGVINLPSIFAGKRIQFILIDYDEEVEMLNQDIEEVNVFK